MATTSSSQTQTLQALSLKQTPVPIQPASLIKNPGQGTQVSTGGKSSSSDSATEGGKKTDSAAVTEVRAINMSRSVPAVSARPLIAPGEWRSNLDFLESENVFWVLRKQYVQPKKGLNLNRNQLETAFMVYLCSKLFIYLYVIWFIMRD